MATDYLVSYANGTGGHFLMSIIGHTVLDNVPSSQPWMLKQVNTPLKAGQFNDAHMSGQFRNFVQIELKNPKGGDIDIEEEFYNIHRLTPGRPVFLPTHFYWPEKQFKKWPNAKIAVITHTDDDLLDIAINSFYKTEMSEDWQKNHKQSNYNGLWFNSNNVMFNNLRTTPLQELSQKDLRIAVKCRISIIITAGYHFIEPEDDPRITYISYRDLVRSVDAVADMITQTTGKTPPSHVVEEIKGYQQRQSDFIAKTKLELNL